MTDFNVPDMTCDGCIQAITRAITAVDASAQVSADLGAHRVRVLAGVPHAALIAAMEDAGFTPKAA